MSNGRVRDKLLLSWIMLELGRLKQKTGWEARQAVKRIRDRARLLTPGPFDWEALKTDRKRGTVLGSDAG